MTNSPLRKSYPSDVTDDEWAFVAPYLSLIRADAPNVITSYANSSTGCDGWFGAVRRGECRHMICRLGRPCISKPGVG